MKYQKFKIPFLAICLGLFTTSSFADRFDGVEPMKKIKRIKANYIKTSASKAVVVYGQRGKCNATSAPTDVLDDVSMQPINGKLSEGGQAYRKSGSCDGKVLVREVIYKPNDGFKGTEIMKMSGDYVIVVVK